MISVASIMPAGKHTPEHIVPLSADGNEPPTHYGLHGWEPAGKVASQDETVQSRVDVYRKEHIDKLPLAENEKTARSSFDQLIASMGLTQIVRGIPTADPKGEPEKPDDLKA